MISYAYVSYVGAMRGASYIVNVKHIEDFYPAAYEDFDAKAQYRVKWERSNLEDKTDGFYPAFIKVLGATIEEVHQRAAALGLKEGSVLKFLGTPDSNPSVTSRLRHTAKKSDKTMNNPSSSTQPKKAKKKTALLTVKQERMQNTLDGYVDRKRSERKDEKSQVKTKYAVMASPEAASEVKTQSDVEVPSEKEVGRKVSVAGFEHKVMTANENDSIKQAGKLKLKHKKNEGNILEKNISKKDQSGENESTKQGGKPKLKTKKKGETAIVDEKVTKKNNSGEKLSEVGSSEHRMKKSAKVMETSVKKPHEEHEPKETACKAKKISQHNKIVEVKKSSSKSRNKHEKQTSLHEKKNKEKGGESASGLVQRTLFKDVEPTSHQRWSSFDTVAMSENEEDDVQERPGSSSLKSTKQFNLKYAVKGAEYLKADTTERKKSRPRSYSPVLDMKSTGALQKRKASSLVDVELETQPKHVKALYNATDPEKKGSGLISPQHAEKEKSVGKRKYCKGSKNGNGADDKKSWESEEEDIVERIKNDLLDNSKEQKNRLTVQNNKVYLGNRVSVPYSLWERKLRGCKQDSAFVNDLVGGIYGRKEAGKRTLSGQSKTGSKLKATPSKIRLINACVKGRLRARGITDEDLVKIHMKQAKDTIVAKFYESSRERPTKIVDSSGSEDENPDHDDVQEKRFLEDGTENEERALYEADSENEERALYEADTENEERALYEADTENEERALYEADTDVDSDVNSEPMTISDTEDHQDDSVQEPFGSGTDTSASSEDFPSKGGNKSSTETSDDDST